MSNHRRYLASPQVAAASAETSAGKVTDPRDLNWIGNVIKYERDVPMTQMSTRPGTYHENPHDYNELATHAMEGLES